jgi:hypothetical protein
MEQRAAERFHFLEQRLAQLSQQKPAEPEPPVPDKDTNYAAWLEYQIQVANRKISDQDKRWQETEADRQQRQAWEQQQAQEQQLISHYMNDARTYASEVPDWQPAYNAWTQGRIEDWMEAGATYEEAKNNQRLEERTFVVNALRSGKRPSEAVYRVAKRYVSTGDAGAPTNDPPRAPNGQFVPAQPKAPLPTPPRSLSRAPGVPGGQTDTQDILRMSNKEFSEKFGGDNWAKLMGGRG